MKKFGVRILFFGIPGLIFVFLTFGFYYFVQLQVKDEAQNISNYECLLMGDSQIQRLNSNLLATKTLNIASSAEHFYFTYSKLLKILQNKDYKVKKIILGVSVHNFAPVYNKLFSLKVQEGKSSLEKYLHFLSSPYDKEFLNFRPFPFVNAAKGIFKGSDWGGMYESNHSNPDEITISKTFEMHFSVGQSEEKYSDSQRKYLYKIDSLCLLSNIDLYICSLPYHPTYMARIKECYYDYFYETVGELKNAYHINFLSDIPRLDWMSDANHLNVDGAAIYSEKIDDIIKAHAHNAMD